MLPLWFPRKVSLFLCKTTRARMGLSGIPRRTKKRRKIYRSDDRERKCWGWKKMWTKR